MRLRFDGGTAEVRSDDQVWQPEECVVARQGLRVSHVEPGCGNLAFFERDPQRIGVHNRPACGVDKMAVGCMWPSVRALINPRVSAVSGTVSTT
jgi:hypothetical protein